MPLAEQLPFPGTGMDALLNSATSTQNILSNIMQNRRANQLMPSQLQLQQLNVQQQQLANQQAQRQNLLEKFKYAQQLKALKDAGYDVSGMGAVPASVQQPNQQSTANSTGSQYPSFPQQENAQGNASVVPSYNKLMQMFSPQAQQQAVMQQANQPNAAMPASAPNEIEVTPSNPLMKVEGILTPVKTEIKGNNIQHTYGDGRVTITPLPSGAAASEIGKEIADLESIKNRYGENSPQYQLANKALNAKIGQQQSLTNIRNNPLRFAPMQAKNLSAFQDQLKREFPNYSEEQLGQLTNALISGDDNINGQPLPEVSSTAKTLLNSIYKTSSTAAMQNNAANLNNTLNELEKIDLTPLKEYTGIGGTAKFLAQQANPSTRTKAWYDYDAFKNSTRIMAMDALRKGFGTSVVPDYVYATLGKISNPVDPIWGDPEQVQTRWNKSLDYLRSAAKNATEQARHGATTLLSPGNNPAKSFSEPTMTIIDSNGTEHIIFSKNIEDAKKIDPGLKVKK